MNRLFGFAAISILSVVGTVGLCTGATNARFSGSLVGSVKNSSGTPQLGALVQLYNRYDRLLQSVSTDSEGEFSFDSLFPEVYSIRVTLASFVPAMKRNISIQPGTRSLLAINLASVLSSVEIVSTSPNAGALMTDDWKWVLRSTMSTRPVLRLRDESISASADHHALFSDTRGLVKVSSGETNPYASVSNQPDLATSFALATSLYGNHKLQFTGNIGYGASALPTTGFRTTFSREDQRSPEVKLTMQQVYLPVRGFGAGQQDAVPALRSMALTVMDRLKLTDSLDFVYGSSLDSVTFLDRLNYMSPFAKLSYRAGDAGVFSVAYSSGAPPVELLNLGAGDRALEEDIAALSMFPRVSLRDGAARVQRVQNFEAGYQIGIGSRSYSVGFYRESVRNGAVTMMASEGLLDSGDLLPELSSTSSVFNIGDYSRDGITASVTQSVSENLTFTLAYGHGGVLRTSGRELVSGDAEELRSIIQPAQQNWVMTKMSGVAPGTGTRFVASYQWTDYRSLIPGHVYLTQGSYPETGLNVRVRQPIPNFAGLPGRLEASAEMRNMLAQGYLGAATPDGRRVTMTNSPRAVRGGLSFIF